ncbi:MAG: class I SAM-dependent methyltransferase [Phycisphaeraceae bacterium]|nr:class I SAM-dependent methyltransferase [Phycisphaeraceae bacterium]
MIDPHVNNPKSPKYHVKRYLNSIKNDLNGAVVLDLAAGSGVTSEILLELGAKVEAFDLFPEYFVLKDIPCTRADILDRIPLPDAYADFIICQEGVEHFSDQFRAYREFNRLLKPGGKLIITTPSYTNLKAKLGYFLFECEGLNHLMPPNELDSVWLSQKSLNDEIYYGHIFLTGIQKLRVIGKLTGFKIDRVIFTRINKTSLFLLILFYPLILLSSYITYKKCMKRNTKVINSTKAKVYHEQLSLNNSPKILIDSHTFVVYEKEMNAKNVYDDLHIAHASFNPAAS